MSNEDMSMAPAGWSSDVFTNYDDLQLGGFDLDLGFQEGIPDVFHDTVPNLAVDFHTYPPSHESVDLMTLSSAAASDLCDISHSHASSISPFQDSSVSSVPSSSSSPVQFESWPLDSSPVNVLPQGYQHPQFYETNFVNGRKRRACDEPCRLPQMPGNVAVQAVNFPVFSTDVASKPKRKRVQNARQRKAANVRERKRMFHLNEAFDSLKTKVPTFNYEKRLSRIETLRLAMTYISFMSDLLAGKKPSEISLKPDGMLSSDNSFTLEDLENLKQSIASSYNSDGTESSECGSSSS
ncbi:uncharacterized protein LOC135478139 [Liolophura sinensis]|uniref:uncharacterized protein LOC135478139 n=1 Tax=Liolophura sinensis TaxID=3198878 RepID=UPI003159585B